MKTLKKQIVNIALIFIFSLCTPSLFAQGHVVLTAENVKKVAAEVAMYHGNGKIGYELAVLDFLTDQLPDKVAKEKRCEAIKPIVLEAEFGRYITFDWSLGFEVSEEGTSYTINALDLLNFNRQHKTTFATKVTFKGLARNYYLFSFIKNCLNSGTQSHPVIIIADEDIFTLPPTFEHTAGGEWRNKDTEDFSLATNNHWQVSPNPFEEGVNLQWQSNKKEPVQIFLYDLQGRLLRQSKINSAIGQQSFWLPLAELSNGYYILRVQTADQNVQHKLIKY